MALFGDWLQQLLSGQGQQQPTMAGAGAPMPAPQMQPMQQASGPTSQAPAAPPSDALAALAAFQQKQAQEPSGWKKALGLFGGALKDYSAFSAGHPERSTGMSDYMNGIRTRQLAPLVAGAQNQVLGELSDPKQKSTALMHIAKLISMGADVTPMTSYISLQNSMAKEDPKYGESPQYTKDGRAYVIGNDGSVKWLDGVKAPGNPNQPFNIDGSPNAAYQAYELKMKSTGVPKTPKAPASPNPFDNPGTH